MKRFVRIFFLFFTLVLSSCFREELDVRMEVPEGTPVKIVLDFNTEDMLDVQVGTKAESSRADESRVHDLYVMIFNNDDGSCFYNRFFSYEHLETSRAALLSKPNEGWFVENVTLEELATPATKDKKTRGIVKISTEAHENCTLVLLANVVNAVTSLDDEEDPVGYLSGIENLTQLKNIKVVLEQHAVNRKDLFLMMGVKGDPDLGDTGWDTSLMTWDGGTGDYTATYQVPLKPLDAKVKFRVRGNSDYISLVNPQFWRVYRLPEEGYLYPDPSRTSDPGQKFFDTGTFYFEGEESDADGTWQVFTFYMLQNRQEPRLAITQANYNAIKEAHSSGEEDWQTNITNLYHCRELQNKTPDTDHEGFMKNGDWVFAPLDATYVSFDLILTLKDSAISEIAELAGLSEDFANALTTDAIFTVHLGNFTSSQPVTPEETAGGITHNYDDYNTLRGVYYTYDIVINNSKSIYVEVRGTASSSPQETQPGQEGSLLLTTDGIINCDAHYEYHTMVFDYDEELGDNTGETPWVNRKKFSWYIKTPFNPDGIDPTLNPATGWYELRKDPKNPEKTLDYDYQWVLYTLNEKSGSVYTTARQAYPGDVMYNPGWYPYQLDQEKQPQYQQAYPDDYYNTLSSSNQAILDAALSAKGLTRATCFVPLLMDINQLVNFLFWQNEEKFHNQPSHLFDSANKIRVTAFVNEYYYERDPFTGQLDPNLWRTFVNAKPRELHILSDNEHSLDRGSDVVTSNQSIIQQSIQTIYNTYSPELSSLWGTEHNDELHKGSEKDKAWSWWPTGRALPVGSVLYNDEENGRINTAGLWGLTSGLEPRWNDFLNYAVDNDQPELREYYHALAYACMTRNRDNDGDGIIDPTEVRWYTASINQLVGMWVGNEALSQTARLYQPVDATNTTDPLKWRSETISSTCGSSTDPSDPYIIRSEEGATKSDYSFYTFWTKKAADRDKISSVRCLRNVGTFRDGGSQKDVTEAPYDRMVDQYFDFKEGTDGNGKAWSNEDGSYTIEFTRLSPRSIREYTAEDLPYHEEYSLHNCVYLNLTAQDPHYWKDDVHKDGGTAYYTMEEGKKVYIRMDEINNQVSMHNDFCPPGYRLPNMTELLMMVASLPSTYWSDKTVYPSRSYFSRGKLGSNKTSTESDKIGWGFNKTNSYRMNLIHTAGEIKGVRCVKDDSSMQGDITGKVIVTNPYRQTIGGEMEIELNFTSHASAIQEVSLALFYNKDGVETPVPIEYELPDASTTIQDEFVYFTIPSTISVRGQMTVKAVVRNAKGVVREFSAPIRVLSDLDLSIKLLPCEYDPIPTAAESEYPWAPTWTPITYTPKFPILLTAHNDNDLKIKNWTLLVTHPDGHVQKITNIPLRPNHAKHNPDNEDITYSGIIYDYDPYANSGSLQQGTYTFQLEAVFQDGEIERLTRSEVVSMNILKVNYQPNTSEDIDTAIAKAIAANPKKNVIELLTGLWRREKVDGLDFSSGDFIETTMDITRCTYKKIDGNKYHDFGLDNLISFGVNGIDWSPNEYHIYFPARPDGSSSASDYKFLYPTPVWDNGSGYAGILAGQPPIDKLLQIRLDNNGFFWNDIPIGISQWSQEKQADVRSVIEKLLRSSTLYVGSTEGPHRSRAYYYYVRAVYNGRDSAIRGGNSNFKENPGNGGNL